MIKLSTLKNRIYFFRWIWFKNLKRKERKFRSKTDLEIIQSGFEKAFGRKPDFDNPCTFYEKLNWLKLYYRNGLMPIVADKYLVREYLKGKGFSYILNEIFAVWNNVREIDISKLPTSFVLKATHASGTGWMEIIKKKGRINFFLKKIMKEWMNNKIDWMGGEWHYGEMPPRIIAEKYLEDSSGELKDYKFHCFAGETKFVSVFSGRFSSNKMVQLTFDKNWTLVPLTYDSVDEKTLHSGLQEIIEKPKNFEQMLQISEELSSPFPYVRIDLYNINGKIYFGEFTFFNASGFHSNFTDAAQLLIGSWIDLPTKHKQCQKLM